MIITFLLLGISIFAVWMPTIRIYKRQIPPWEPIFICAITSGLIFGYLTAIAIVELSILSVCVYSLRNSNKNNWQRGILCLVTLLFALALAIHRLPGFNNPVLFTNIKLSEDASPYTQYLNFDKAAAGLILLGLCIRSRTRTEWKTTIWRTYPIAMGTTAIVVLTALLSGYIKFEFKVFSYTPIFLATNLLFTCVAEEAFFRGILQDKLASILTSRPYGNIIAILLSSILFGISHIGGGTTFVVMSTIAGIGNAYAYYITKRIEGPILTHFSLNVVHFIFFTYPHL